MKRIGRLCVVVGALLAVVFPLACSSKKKRAAPPPEVKLALEIEASQATGSMATMFELNATLTKGSTSDYTYQWDLGDGTQATGGKATISYAAPGMYVAQLVATHGTTMEVLNDDIVLTVIDPTAPMGVFGNPLPLLPGDVDLDGKLSLGDAQRVHQHLAGLVILTDANELDQADFDLDGRVTEDDAHLLSQALLAGTSSPSEVVPDQAMPGQVISVFSDALTSLDAKIEIAVGSSKPFEPLRMVLGQVSFPVPLDVLTPGKYTLAGGAAEIRILSDGLQVDSLQLTVLPAPPIDGAPLAKTIQMIEGLAALRAEQLVALDAFFATPLALALGFTADDAQVLRTILAAGDLEMSAIEKDQTDFLKTLTRPQAEAVARFGMANGLGEAIQSTEMALSRVRLGRVNGLDVPPSAVQALCNAELVGAALKKGHSAAGYICSALSATFFVAVLLPEPILDGPALVAAVTACAKYLALAEIPGIVLDFIPKIGPNLTLTPQGPTAVKPGESVALMPQIKLVGLAELCGTGSGKLQGGLTKYISKKVTYAVLKKKPLFQLYKAARSFSQATAKKVVELVIDQVDIILKQTPLETYLAELAKHLCGKMQNIGGLVSLEAATLQVVLLPVAGSVTQSTDFITYTCPTDPTALPNGEVLLTASLPTCKGPLSGSVKISCKELKPVTITMGDNGSLLDDIFEVVVDGKSVLTSGIPVTSTSTVLQLSVGDHPLQMKGLAAPDGIGTYFIQVTGGTLDGLSYRSGSNLSAGTTFSWTLNVN